MMIMNIFIFDNVNEMYNGVWIVCGVQFFCVFDVLLFVNVVVNEWLNVMAVMSILFEDLFCERSVLQLFGMFNLFGVIYIWNGLNSYFLVV